MSCLYAGHWKIPLAGTGAAHGHHIAQRAELGPSPPLLRLHTSNLPSFLLKLPIFADIASSFGGVCSSSREGQAQVGHRALLVLPSPVPPSSSSPSKSVGSTWGAPPPSHLETHLVATCEMQLEAQEQKEIPEYKSINWSPTWF